MSIYTNFFPLPPKNYRTKIFCFLYVIIESEKPVNLSICSFEKKVKNWSIWVSTPIFNHTHWNIIKSVFFFHEFVSIRKNQTNLSIRSEGKAKNQIIWVARSHLDYSKMLRHFSNEALAHTADAYLSRIWLLHIVYRCVINDKNSPPQKIYMSVIVTKIGPKMNIFHFCIIQAQFFLLKIWLQTMFIMVLKGSVLLLDTFFSQYLLWDHLNNLSVHSWDIAHLRKLQFDLLRAF